MPYMLAYQNGKMHTWVNQMVIMFTTIKNIRVGSDHVQGRPHASLNQALEFGCRVQIVKLLRGKPRRK